MPFLDYSATDLLDEADAYGFWWADEDDDVKSIKRIGNTILVRLNDTDNPGYDRVVEVTGTALRQGWSEFKRQHPNAWLANNASDVDAEVAGVMAQMVVYGKVVFG